MLWSFAYWLAVTKDANVERAKRKDAELLAQWRNPATLKVAAE